MTETQFQTSLRPSDIMVFSNDQVTQYLGPEGEALRGAVDQRERVLNGQHKGLPEENKM